jgi:hypothetical protein
MANHAQVSLRVACDPDVRPRDADLAAAAQRWARFASAARHAGFAAVQACRCDCASRSSAR